MPQLCSSLRVYWVMKSLPWLAETVRRFRRISLPMRRALPLRANLVALFLLLVPAAAFAHHGPHGAASGAPASPAADSPAFTTVPELRAGFDLLYEQKFTAARDAFSQWASAHPDEPFGETAIAASYLFEELYRQNVLTSEFFLDEKRFLRGIDGQPDAETMKQFRAAVARARQLSSSRQKKDPNDGEALFALTLTAGMESDASTILEKKHLDGLKHMKEANKYGKQLLAEYPDTNDAYVALGIANYVIGSLNGGERFALWFGGIHGDKKLGMEQVTKTTESGRYLQPFAKITLALAARREKQPTLATKLLLELKEQYPNSTLFAAEYAKAASAHKGD